MLYTRIAVGLWRSAKGIERRVVQQNPSSNSNRCGGTNCTTHCATADVQVINFHIIYRNVLLPFKVFKVLNQLIKF